MKKVITLNSSQETTALAEKIGHKLRGGELIELSGDLGSGKTTFVSGLVLGAGSSDKVASPTFVINKVYKADKCGIYHFDFYRLHSPGLIKYELSDILNDKKAVIVIEWSDIVPNILPLIRLKVEFVFCPDINQRRITLIYSDKMKYLI